MNICMSVLHAYELLLYLTKLLYVSTTESLFFMICQLFRTYSNGAQDIGSYASDWVMHCVVGCMWVCPKYRHLFSFFLFLSLFLLYRITRTFLLLYMHNAANTWANFIGIVWDKVGSFFSIIPSSLPSYLLSPSPSFSLSALLHLPSVSRERRNYSVSQ